MGTIAGTRQGTNQTDSREVEREEIEMYVPEFGVAYLQQFLWKSQS